MLFDLFVPAPLALAEMGSRDARHILSARSWCILRNASVDPHPQIEKYLLSDLVAIRFSLLMDCVTQFWPEAFAIHRLCCGKASIDEALFVQAVHLAGANRRKQFDLLLEEMLSFDARTLFFARANALYA